MQWGMSTDRRLKNQAVSYKKVRLTFILIQCHLTGFFAIAAQKIIFKKKGGGKDSGGGVFRLCPLRGDYVGIVCDNTSYLLKKVFPARMIWSIRSGFVI